MMLKSLSLPSNDHLSKLLISDEQKIKYWKFLEEKTSLEIPADKVRPSKISHKRVFYKEKLSPTLSKQINFFASHQQIDSVLIFLGAFQTLLYRYCNQKNFVLGVSVNNDQEKDRENIFLEKMPLHMYCDGNESFFSLLTNLKRKIEFAHFHQTALLSHLLKLYSQQDFLSQSSIFQTLFSFNVLPTHVLLDENLTTVNTNHVLLDIALDINKVGEEFFLSFDGAADLFELATIKRMSGHFCQLLQAAIDHPYQALNALELLTAPERYQLFKWNQNQRIDEQNGKSIFDLFEEQVIKHPHATAVICENTRLTYWELHQRSNQLAYYLKKQGVKPETLVGLCIKNELNLIISIWGILKAGGVYLPLDPTYPKERLKFMLDDAKPLVLITQTDLTYQFSHYQNKLIELDRCWEEIFCSTHANASIDYSIQPHHLAYVIYTSGSTGKPKGIMINHESLPHLALAHKAFYPDDLVGLLTGAISFDVSILIIFHILISGGIVCLPPAEAHLDAEKMIDLIEQYSINFLVCVPSLYTMLLEKSRPLLSLKSVSLAGENISNHLVSMHSHLALHAILYNEYGPTECAIGTTIAKIYDPIERKIHKMSAGHPLPNTQVYILDSNFKLLPTGFKGEIFIGGVGLARGYLNNSDLTSEKFIWISLNGQPPIRLYKTGDFGRWQSNGELEFLGRLDHQVKIRGYRIELGEIEYAISQYQSIKEAVLVARENEMNHKQLIAYYSTSTQTALNESLRVYLKDILPQHMIPDVFIHVKGFSRTPNGKVDREKLPAVEMKLANIQEVSPQSEIEWVILDIWKKVINFEGIRMHDNFFDLGGNSLQVARVQTLIKEVLNLKVSIIDLYQYPTILQLANYLDQKQKETINSQIILKNQNTSNKQRAAFQRLKERALEKEHVFNE